MHIKVERNTYYHLILEKRIDKILKLEMLKLYENNHYS